MLKNVSSATVDLKWAGASVSVKPGESLSVETAFGAKDKGIVAIEDRFVSKFGGAIIKFEPKAIPEPAPEPIMPVKVAVAHIETPKKPILEPIHKAGRPAKIHSKKR
jgi:hypothetical protein